MSLRQRPHQTISHLVSNTHSELHPESPGANETTSVSMKQKELNLISDYEPSGIMYADGGFRRGFI